MVCGPPINCVAVVVKVVVAVPLTFIKVPLPNIELPSLKVTVPVGCTPLIVGVTVAVSVTGWPKVEGLGEDIVMVVVALAGLTVCVKEDEVLPLKLVSPL